MSEPVESPPQLSRVLVVEDEPGVRDVWARFLERWGYAADVAENGQVALELARKWEYRLVVTDLEMPVMSGQELVRRLKAEQPELELIVTTGHASIEVAVEMMKAGAYDFITKPIDFHTAQRTVQKCMDAVEARRENARLRELNRDLEELNQLKEKFIAITSHELRSPVSIISNVIDLLEPVLASGEEEPLLAMLHSAAGRLRDIVDEMHEISQLNSSKIPLRHAPVDLPALFAEVTEEHRNAAQVRRHQLTWEAPAGTSVQADRAKLRKVLRELLQNAIKFTPDGGHIAVSARCDDGECAITVTDDGIGIPAGERERIFQLFYEISDTSHHHSSGSEFRGGGMGVGLALVDDIVAAHGGRIRVDSEVGQGSRFTVALPGAAMAPRN